MFMGVKGSATSAHNYSSAVEALESCTKTPTGRQRSADYYGYPLNRARGKDAVAKVRKLHDDSIAFRLYQTDVVVWHPDNTCSIDNWGSVTTGQFARQFTPPGVSLNVDGTIDYQGAERPSDWDHGGESWKHFWQSQRVCRGINNEVTFALSSLNLWEPQDEDQLVPFEAPVLDRKIARAAAREYNLADFKAWLQLVTFHTYLEHEGENFSECIDALKVRDFKRAAVHLPTTRISNGFGIKDRIKPLRFRNVYWAEPVTMTSLQRVRDYVYDQAGAFSTEKFTTMSRSQLERVRARTNALAKAQVYL